MRDILNSYTTAELKKHISTYNKSLGAVKGYSKMTKAQLIDLMTKKENVSKFKSIKMKVKQDKKVVKKSDEKKVVKKSDEKKVVKKSDEKKVIKKSDENKKKTINEIVEILTKYKRAEPVNFICYEGMQDFLYLKILGKHKNDCVWNYKFNQIKFGDLELSKFDSSSFFGWNNLDLIGISEQHLFKIRRKKEEGDVKKFMDTIMNKYLECAKRNKMLVIPLSLKEHANMLIFNPVLKQLERYEPHGIGTGGQTNRALDQGLEKIAKYISDNGNNKKYTENFRFSPSIESCPILPKGAIGKGLQSYDGTPQQIKQRKTIDGVLLEDPGGFCCMWSYLQMDYRLSNPSLKPNELGTELMKKFKSNPKKFMREFIRGYTWKFMEDLIKGIGGLKILDELNKDKVSDNNTNLKFDKIIKKLYEAAIKN